MVKEQKQSLKFSKIKHKRLIVKHMEETTERLSTKKEEKTMAFYVYHPCYCLEEIFKTFLRCFGIESTQTKEEEDSSTSLLKPHACACASDSNVALKDHYYSSSSNKKSSQEEGVADPPPSTSTRTIVCIYLFI